jgi:hypothetical protein
MTLRFLSKVVPLALLFASGTWAQFDMAACPADWEWVRPSVRFFLGTDAPWVFEET